MIAAVVLLVGLGADSAADAVTLRDGKVVLGQIVEGAPRGRLGMVVRRAWAEGAMPDRLKTWEAAEAPSLRRARSERLARLKAWKDDGASGPVASWIDSETERLNRADARPPLLFVTIGRGDLRKIDRRPPDAARKLRQAWRAGFEDAETKPLDELTSALEGRGFPMTGDDPAAVDDLLPVPAETEAHWRARRAATEVAQDRGLRWVRYGGFLMPEGTPGEQADVTKALGGLAKTLLGDAPAEDPLEAKGREVAAKGKVGLMVTALETAEDLSGVTVDIILYARMPGDRWERAAAKRIQVRGDDLRRGEGGNIANDPQVKNIFGAMEGLGLAVPDELKQKSLAIGAATQKALGLARSAIQPDLDALAFPVDSPSNTGAK